MLDSLRIDPSRVLTDSEREQKLQDHFVPFAGRVRETPATARQCYGGVGLSFGQSVSLQTGYCPVDRNMSDAELTREVRNAALAFFSLDFVDRLDIVLGKFRRVGATRPNVLVSGFPAGWHERSNVRRWLSVRRILVRQQSNS